MRVFRWEILPHAERPDQGQMTEKITMQFLGHDNIVLIIAESIGHESGRKQDSKSNDQDIYIILREIFQGRDQKRCLILD